MGLAASAAAAAAAAAAASLLHVGPRFRDKSDPLRKACLAWLLSFGAGALAGEGLLLSGFGFDALLLAALGRRAFAISSSEAWGTGTKTCEKYGGVTHIKTMQEFTCLLDLRECCQVAGCVSASEETYPSSLTTHVVYCSCQPIRETQTAPLQGLQQCRLAALHLQAGQLLFHCL